MGRNPDLSKTKLEEIKTLLLNTNYSQRQIAGITRVSKSTVSRISVKVDKNQNICSSRQGKCGRKRITTLRSDRKIRHICLANRKCSAEWLTKKVQEAGIGISKRTVRRRLAEEGLIGRRPTKKPRLTASMKNKRLQWARTYRNWTVEDWSEVCFSDESTFEILVDKSSFVRRRPWEKYNPDCIVERVKHPVKVMVWSVISTSGMGRLYIVEGMMNQKQYIEVLKKRLIPQLHEWRPVGKKHIFMHDSAPCHKAKSVTAFLNQNGIEVLPWPGNSPDMNPIENIWEFTKRRIAQKVITTKVQLTEKLITVWYRSPELKTIAKNCIESMPRRIQAVITAKESVTKY